jgi:AraC family ethanolamine operon transcriptional activator
MESTTPLHAASAPACRATEAPPGASIVNRHFESDDVDAHAQFIDGWALQLDQMSPGPFRGTLHEIRVGDMQLLRERVNRSLLKRGATAAYVTSFSVPLQTDGPGYCGGGALQERVLLVSNGTSLPELRTPDRHDIAVLTLPAEALASLAALDGDDERERSADSIYLVTLDGQRYDALKAFLVASFDAADAAADAFAYPQACKTLHDAVLLELDRIAESGRPPVRLDRTARRRIVSRVRELVAAQPDAPLTVLDVCRAVGTSRRKLQYCFEEALGTNPAYYLRVLRLNAARRELRRQSPATGSVGDVAFRCGFWHLSRFSLHYRQLFGELPSDTLKRAPQ